MTLCSADDSCACRSQIESYVYQTSHVLVTWRVKPLIVFQPVCACARTAVETGMYCYLAGVKVFLIVKLGLVFVIKKKHNKGSLLLYIHEPYYIFYR